MKRGRKRITFDHWDTPEGPLHPGRVLIKGVPFELRQHNVGDYKAEKHLGPSYKIVPRFNRA